MFADTDFILAMVKDSDWLKEKATQVYHTHKDEIWTNGFVIAEVFIISQRLKLDCEVVVSNIYRMFKVKGLDQETALLAAHFIKHKNVTPFDAIHAASAKPDIILSSDRIFDEVLGLERFKFED